MEIIKGQKTAILFDPHSKVGRYCLDLLLDHEAYELVLVFSEMKKNRRHPKLKWIQYHYDKLDQIIEYLKGDDLFWCRSSFKDWTEITDTSSIRTSLPFKVAWAALQNDISQFLFLSSTMVGSQSWLPVLKQRSELEKIIQELPFWALHIFKPPILIDHSPSSRWGENLAKKISDFAGGIFDNYRPVESEAVARAMVDQAQQIKKGLSIYSSEDLQRMAEAYITKTPRKI